MQHRRTKGKWAKSEFLFCAQSRSQIMQAQMWFHFSWFVRTICSLFQEFRAFYNAKQCSLAKSKVKVNCCGQFGIECTVITLFLIVFAIFAFLKKLPRSFYFQNFLFSKSWLGRLFFAFCFIFKGDQCFHAVQHRFPQMWCFFDCGCFQYLYLISEVLRCFFSQWDEETNESWEEGGTTGCQRWWGDSRPKCEIFIHLLLARLWWHILASGLFNILQRDEFKDGKCAHFITFISHFWSYSTLAHSACLFDLKYWIV